MHRSLYNRRDFLSRVTSLLGAAGLPCLSSFASCCDRVIPTRPLGLTGVQIPVLGLGTAPLGYNLSPGESERLVEIALDLGVSCLDTAYNYGHAQADIGRVLARRREEAFIATKTHTTDGTVARLQLEESLRLLRTDYVDLAHVHSVGGLDVDRVLATGGTLESLLKAKERGLVRFVGVTAHNHPSRVLRILETGCIDVAMVPINFIDRHLHNFERVLLPAAARYRTGIIAMKVFGGAKHVPFPQPSRPPLPKELMDSALRYTLGIPWVSCVVIGMYTADELRGNVKRVGNLSPLSPSDRALLRKEAQRLAYSVSFSWPVA